MIRLCAFLLFVIALGAGIPDRGWAKDQGRHETQPRQDPPLAATQAGMSLDDAVQMVQQHFNARVVRAETRQEKSRTIYVLRLLNEDGKVWTVRVDADSGSIL